MLLPRQVLTAEQSEPSSRKLWPKELRFYFLWIGLQLRSLGSDLAEKDAFIACKLAYHPKTRYSICSVGPPN